MQRNTLIIVLVILILVGVLYIANERSKAVSLPQSIKEHLIEQNVLFEADLDKPIKKVFQLNLPTDTEKYSEFYSNDGAITYNMANGKIIVKFVSDTEDIDLFIEQGENKENSVRLSGPIPRGSKIQLVLVYEPLDITSSGHISIDINKLFFL